jgi:hypothetical protein
MKHLNGGGAIYNSLGNSEIGSLSSSQFFLTTEVETRFRNVFHNCIILDGGQVENNIITHYNIPS